MIKQLLGCRHLLSTKPNGVKIQMYLAIIACLLILIYTGGQPTNTSMSDFFDAFVTDKARELNLTIDQTHGWKPPAQTRRKRKSK